MTGRLQLRKIALAATVAIAGFTASAEEYTLPVTFTPSQTLFDQCTVIDVNGNGKGESGWWTYNSSEQAFKYSFDQNVKADDWIILPAVSFGNASDVTIAFEVKTMSDKESFEVALGKSPEISAMTTPVISKSDFVSTSYDTLTASVTVPTDGSDNEWYLGFHVTSNAFMYNLYIKNITIEAGASDVTVAPAAPVIESSTVDGLDYTASVKMPSANVDGDEITGSMSLKVLVDGYTQDTYTDLSAGEVKSVSLTLEEGEHTIGYQAILEDVASSLVTETVTAQKKVITPVAPVVKSSGVTGGKYTAVVTMPSNDTDGNPITSTMTLQVKEGEATMATIGSCEAGADVDVEFTLTPGNHTLSFFALLNGVSSVATEENVVVPEPVFDLPFTFEPSSNNFGDCVIIDANNDGSPSVWSPEGKWTFDSQNNALCYTYSEIETNGGDDWVIFPMVNFGTANKVTVSFSAKSSSYPEAFEVYFGNERTAAGMTQKVAEYTDFKEGDFKTITLEFDKGDSTETKWALGIHAISEPNKNKLYIKDISITAVAGEVDLPGAAEIQNSAVEGNTYTASVKMPTKTVSGADIESKLTLTISVDGEVKETKENLNAGEVLNIQIPLAQGAHTISYIVSDAEGESEAVTDEVTVEAGEAPVGSLPYTFTVTQASFSECIIIDANEDAYTNSGNQFACWTYANTGDGGAFKYTYSIDNQADDWVILPMVDFGSSRTVEISMDVMTTDSDAEDFEIYLGKERSIEGRTLPVENMTDFSSPNKFRTISK
ncbi:MAG: choice-of-anchor J domain-containing protein, partial [Muribaculaceae bacterium]|nr:choice-of-anchor J domain-containing protein [Muribaculaceae bacterium]